MYLDGQATGSPEMKGVLAARWHRTLLQLFRIILLCPCFFPDAAATDPQPQWPPADRERQLPGGRPGTEIRPSNPDPRRQPGNQAIITLTLEPAEICVGDGVTLRWSVRDPRPNVEWTIPIHIGSSFEIDPPIPNPVPRSGAHSFTAPRTPVRGTFTLTTGSVLLRSEKSVTFRVEQAPGISRLTVENSTSRFEASQRARWGERIGIVGENFGRFHEGHQVLVTMHERTFTVPVRSWEEDRIVFQLDNLIPLGTGTVRVRTCGGRLESAPVPLSVYRDPVTPDVNPEIMTFGAAGTTLTIKPPAIIKPRSADARPRDLSDHYAISVEADFRIGPHPNPVRFSVLTYNIAQVPDPFYEGRRSRDQNIDDIAGFLNRSSFGIVCLQEVFGDSSRSRLISATRDAYPYRAFGPEGHPLEQDSGLVILSRFPILEHHRLEFMEGEGIPDNYVAKGILHVRVELGARSAESIDFFTTHTQSGNGRDEKRNRQHQFEEVLDFIRRHSRGDPWILTGDMNVNGASRDQDQYDAMMEVLSSPWDLWKEFHPHGEEAGFTFGDGNNFKNQQGASEGERLDFILIHCPKAPAPPARGEHRLGARNPQQ